MHPDVVAIWAKSKGRGHLCTSDFCLGFMCVFVRNFRTFTIYVFFFLSFQEVRPDGSGMDNNFLVVE